jgi:LacI family transcriptional regulator
VPLDRFIRHLARFNEASMTTPPTRASVKDVAAAAGVSVGTVSNVLNHPDRVSPATRARVEQSVRDLGFVRNESARQLRAGTSRVLAYVVLDTGNPFFTDVAAGIDDAAAAAKLAVFLCNSGNQRDREKAYLDHLVQQRVLGILVTPVEPESPALAEVVQRGVPVVIVDRTTDDERFCTVAVDDLHGGRVAIEHLIDCGHERVAFVGGPVTLGQVRDRLAGARDAWGAAGMQPNDLVVVETEALAIGDGRAAWERLAGTPSKRRPTAAFCANDLVAIGLLQRVIAADRSVPGDLAIVGYDDIDFAAAAAVPLTSVRQPRHELGRAATELVLDEAANPEHVHQRLLFVPELVARESTLG